MSEIIRLDPQCVNCLLKKHLNACPAGVGEAQRVAYMQRLLAIIAGAPVSWGAPVLVGRINRLREELFGEKEDFSAVKTHFNRLMLSWEEKIDAKIAAAQDPLKAAIQYAMIGNYIDFGVLSQIDDDELTQLIDHPERFAVRESEYAALKAEIGKAKSLVFLTDNCGEIVFDKLLIRRMLRMYPQMKITVIVRGADVLNDATMKDAQEVGLAGMDGVAVISNGSDVAGTNLDELGEAAEAAIRAADVLIAKGQGNHETMRHCGLNVFYIFLCKCDLFARRFDQPRFSGMLIHDSRC